MNSYKYLQALELCGQKEPTVFKDILDDTVLYKINEGAFAYIFVSLDNGKISSVYKIIPFYIDQKDENRNQCSLETTVSELRANLALQTLRTNPSNQTLNFIRLEQYWIVQDKVKDHLGLAEACQPPLFLENSDNYPNTMINYLVQKLEYGGKAISNINNLSALQILSIIAQVGLALEIAQKELNIEHKYLQISNILVRNTSEEHMQFIVNSRKICFPTFGVRATIIVPNLSRYKYKGTEYVCPYPEKYEDFRFKLPRGHWEEFYPETNLFSLRDIGLRMLKECSKKVSKSKQVGEFYSDPQWLEKISRFNSFVEYLEKEFLSLIKEKCSKRGFMLKQELNLKHNKIKDKHKLKKDDSVAFELTKDCYQNGERTFLKALFLKWKKIFVKLNCDCLK